MSSHPSTPSFSTSFSISRRKHDRDVGTKGVDSEAPGADGTHANNLKMVIDNSTEAVALKVLDPTVSEKEQREYQGSANSRCITSVLTLFPRYVDQYQELLEAPDIDYDARRIGGHRDLEVYSNAVRIAFGAGPGPTIESSVASLNAGTIASLGDSIEHVPIPKEYIAYVEFPSRQYVDTALRKDSTNTLGGGGFNYERWLASVHVY